LIDFLVVGGGIAGISAAARLSHLGNVTVLEGEQALGYHASGRSAAMFEETYGLPSTVALNRASRDYHRCENGGVLSPRGLMLVGTADDREDFAHDMVSMEMDAITVTEALDMVPVLDSGVVTQVGYHAAAWDIDTDLLIQNFAREVRGNGGQVLTRQQVSALSRTASGWIIQTRDQTFECRVLVNAAGAWVDQVAAMAGIAPLGFTPLRRSNARIPAPGGHDVKHWPMMFGPGENWYAKPDAGKLLVSPADADPVQPHDAWPEDLVLAQGLARFQAVTTEPVTRLESSWAGLRTFAPDRSLVIGHDPQDPAFLWNAGQGGYGFQTSPAASRLLGDLVAERPSELDAQTIAALSPWRFSRP
jgi:D-arginine dehydrogenase